MSIWVSMTSELEIPAHRHQYGEDEPLSFDVAYSGNGFVRIAAFGFGPAGEFVEAGPIYIDVANAEAIAELLRKAPALDERVGTS